MRSEYDRLNRAFAISPLSPMARQAVSAASYQSGGRLLIGLPVGDPAERLGESRAGDRLQVPRLRGHRVEPGPRLLEVAALLPEPPQQERPAEPRPRAVARPSPSRAPRAGCRARAPGVRARRADRRPTAGARRPRPARPSRRAWRSRTASASPRASSISAAYSRIVSSIEKRCSSGSSSTRMRLWSTSSPIRSMTSPPTSDAGPQTRFGRLELEAAAEHRQAVDEPARPVVEQVVAPRDRATQRLLALGQVPRAGRQQVQVVLEPDQDLVRRQELDPGGRELDGEGHAVEGRADRRDRGRVGVRDREPRLDRAGAGDEQADRLVRVQRLQVVVAQGPRQVQALHLGQVARIGRGRQARHRVLLLAGDAQRDARS